MNSQIFKDAKSQNLQFNKYKEFSNFIIYKLLHK